MMSSASGFALWRLWLVLAPVRGQCPAFRPQRRGKGARGRTGQRHPGSARHQPSSRMRASRALEDKVRGLTESLAQATGANEELSHQIQLSERQDRPDAEGFRLSSLHLVGAAAGRRRCHELRRGRHRFGRRRAPPPRRHAARRRLAADRRHGNGQRRWSAASSPRRSGHRWTGHPACWAPCRWVRAGGRRRPPPPAGDSAQYDQAMNLMSRAQYAEAAPASAPMPTPIPTIPICRPRRSIGWATSASSARTMRRRARAFAEVIKKYPKSPRAPDAMLKLAQSFMAHGPEIGRLHHAWPHQDEISRCLAADPRQRRQPPQNRLRQVSRAEA